MPAISPTASSARWWSACRFRRAAYPRLSHRYYALKARWFGKKTLPYWDRNAPLPFARPTASAGTRRAAPC